MKLFNLFIFFIIIVGCSILPKMQRLDDTDFYEKAGIWDFSSPVEECVSACKQGIKDLGYKVKRHDRKKQVIVSNRKNVLNFQEQDQVTGDRIIKGRKFGYSVQYFLKVTGSKKSCRVELKRMRVFENGSEKDAEAVGFVNGHVKRLKDAIKLNL